MVDVLAGVRVVEVGQVLAGPYAGAIFADLGADVIKVERADGGDDARHMGPAFRHDDALTFHIYNRGKKSVALDLTSKAGKAAFDRLVATADIMLHNLRPGGAGQARHRRPDPVRPTPAPDLLRDLRLRPYRAAGRSPRVRAADPGL